VPALDNYGGRKSYYTEDERAMFRNPERYYYGPAKGSAEKFFAGINSKARSRQMGEAAASQAIPTSYASFGTQSTSPNLSLSGFSGQTSGGTAGLAGLSNYANGGPVVEGLQAYLEKVSPEAKGALTKVANEMSPQQQQEFLGNLQYGDLQFQTEVAPYMPEGATIDPSIGRLKTFPEEAGIGPLGLNTRGYSTNTSRFEGRTLPSLTVPFDGYEIQLEPDTVTAVEAVNANPTLFSHEYRHFEGSDASDQPKIVGEGLNRLQDLMASQNSADLADNARMVVEILHRGAYSEGEKKRHNDMYRRIRGSTEEETVKFVQEILEEPVITRYFNRFQDLFENAAKSPYFNKITGSDESPQISSIETLRGYLPEGYAEDNKSRLDRLELGGVGSLFKNMMKRP
tara:strand:- start:268 stop:1464 length:1197 start_codon:yes stop_codon:yes gene_type:complete